MDPKLPSKPKQEALRGETIAIIVERRRLLIEGNLKGANDLVAEIKRSKRSDKREYMLNKVSKQFDERDRWMGIRRSKAAYRHQPYH